MEYDILNKKVMQELYLAGTSNNLNELSTHKNNIHDLIKAYKESNPQNSNVSGLRSLAESKLIAIMSSNGIIQNIMQDAIKNHTQNINYKMKIPQNK